jgi:hypothetical protein
LRYVLPHYFLCLFRRFPASRRYNKVVGISYKMYLVVERGVFPVRRLRFFPLEAVFHQGVQTVERMVRQQGAYDSPLRCSPFGWKQFMLIHIARLEKLFQYGFVHRGMFQKPFVRYFVKTCLYVPFYYPFRRVFLRQ